MMISEEIVRMNDRRRRRRRKNRMSAGMGGSWGDGELRSWEEARWTRRG